MNTKIIKFDLNKYKLYENIKAKQKDTKSRFLLFQLLDGSIPFDLTNRSVRAYMIKPDGNEIFNDLIINNYSLGYCTLELTNQVLAVPGKVKIELMITEEDKKLTSSVFELEVIKSINSENSIVSTNEFTALLNGLASLSEYDNYKNEIKNARGGEVKLKDRLDKFGEQLDKKATKEELSIERKRIDLLTKIEGGETTGNAELLDIRVGADGETYETAGDSVRTQIKNISNKVTQNTEKLSTVSSKLNDVSSKTNEISIKLANVSNKADISYDASVDICFLGEDQFVLEDGSFLTGENNENINTTKFYPKSDSTLTEKNLPANAKVVGDKINNFEGVVTKTEKKINTVSEVIDNVIGTTTDYLYTESNGMIYTEEGENLEFPVVMVKTNVELTDKYKPANAKAVGDKVNLISQYENTISNLIGEEYFLILSNDGTLSTLMKPKNFPIYDFQGNSINHDDYIFAPTTSEGNRYMIIFSYDGKVKGYIKRGGNFDGFFAVKHYLTTEGNHRYTIQVPTWNGAGFDTHDGLIRCTLHIYDENLNPIKTDIKMLPYGSITEPCGTENHDYILFSDNHYLLSAVLPCEMTNIPNYEGKKVKVVNTILQEVKDDRVVWQFETKDYPELYGMSCLYNDYDNYTSTDSIYSDCLHFNSIQIDKKTGQYLLSFRNLGLIKIDPTTKTILWAIGTGNIPEKYKIKGVTNNEAPYLQHDARYTEDGAITVFDNSGGPQKNLRIIEYSIDESSKSLINFTEYITPYIKSLAMGSAKKVADNVFDIAYGMNTDNPPAFEQYDFKNDRANVSFRYGNSKSNRVYRVFSGIEKCYLK